MTTEHERTQGPPIDASDAMGPDDGWEWQPDGEQPSVTLNISAFTGAVAADSLARRVKALACTAPLHALQSNKTRVADGRYWRLNCWELALFAIDAVAVAMDFDTGASYDQVVDVVASQASRHDTDLSVGECRTAAQWIIEGLISGRGGDDAFHATYGRWDDGPYQARGFHVELLTEHADPAGNIYLRASDHGINVLIGALDTDIESAAEAVDAKMASLVRRGMWSEAVLAAEHARYRSIQYAEMIRREVVATRQNVAEVDWVQRVPELIERALDHVLSRYRTERTIIGNVTRSRDEATEPRLRTKASQMLVLLKDCQARHEALQRKLLGVREEFREATREQLARPAPSVALVDLERQILVPLLDAAVQHTASPVDRFFTRLSAPTAVIADIDRLVTTLCQPPRDNDTDDNLVDPPELVDVRRDPRFDDVTWDTAEALLADCDRPTRLSALLARAEARHGAGDVSHLVALLAMRAVDPGLGHRIAAGEQAIVLAADDGVPLDHARFSGSDVLVVRATTAPLATADHGAVWA